MGYLSELELNNLGLKFLGKNVKVSESAMIYDPSRISIGDNSRIDDFCVLSGTVSIGRNVMVSLNCNIAGGSPGITIGDFSTLAYRIDLFAQSDDYSGFSATGPTIPRKFKPSEIFAPISIERYCIIGAASTIFPGVTIKEGCAIGAQSLVNKTLPPWGIYVGIPAKKIKNRSKECLNFYLEYLRMIMCNSYANVSWRGILCGYLS
jgi:acetyltransferase-like isoleucine patch superfamily enzyme